ncbi:MAG: hypothetical protein QMB43_04950, partial [Alistipes putredinis]
MGLVLGDKGPDDLPRGFGVVAGGAGRELVLGAVKTNIGHLEAAAGVAGLIKLVMALDHGFAPPNLHLETVNPDLDLEGFAVKMPGKGGAELVGDSRGRLLGGVSSFGFGGTNAHVLLEVPRGTGGGG